MEKIVRHSGNAYQILNQSYLDLEVRRVYKTIRNNILHMVIRLFFKVMLLLGYRLGIAILPTAIENYIVLGWIQCGKWGSCRSLLSLIGDFKPQKEQ